MAKQVGTVYGTALYEAAVDAGRLSDIRQEAEVILEALKENPEFLKLLCHPDILPEERRNMLEAVFGEDTDPLIRGTAAALMEKKHEKELPAVLMAFTELALNTEHIGVASVLSAVELTEAQKLRIQQKLLDTTEYTSMRISYDVEPELIGGLVIKLGDRVVDSSIRTTLHDLKNTLLN